MSIIDTAWSNTKPSILEDLRTVAKRAQQTGYAPMDPVIIASILQAVEYGYQLDRKRHAKETRRRKKRHKRKMLRKQKQ